MKEQEILCNKRGSQKLKFFPCAENFLLMYLYHDHISVFIESCLYTYIRIISSKHYVSHLFIIILKIQSKYYAFII